MSWLATAISLIKSTGSVNEKIGADSVGQVWQNNALQVVVKHRFLCV
jgi:hypothetical protein